MWGGEGQPEQRGKNKLHTNENKQNVEILLYEGYHMGIDVNIHIAMFYIEKTMNGKEQKIVGLAYACPASGYRQFDRQVPEASTSATLPPCFSDRIQWPDLDVAASKRRCDASHRTNAKQYSVSLCSFVHFPRSPTPRSDDISMVA